MAAVIFLLDASLLEDSIALPSHFVKWAKQPVNREKRTLIIAGRPTNQDWGIYDRIILLKRGSIVADLQMDDLPEPLQKSAYRIKVKGALSQHWVEWFSGFTISTEKGETMLTGEVADQAALHGLLNRIRDLGLPLISVNRVYPNLEKALQKLMEDH